MSDSKLIRQASLSSAYMDPSQRIKVLVEYGSHLEVDKTLAVKHYFRSGHEMLRMANMYCDDGQLESAFILYYRYITLFMEKLPSHPEYSSANHAEVAEIKRRMKKVFPIAEEIKLKLKKRYTEEELAYKEQQRSLAAERAAQEEERRKALEEQQKLDEELARKLQEEEEAEIQNLQEEKYLKLRKQEEERLKYEEERKKQVTAHDVSDSLVVYNGGTCVPETSKTNAGSALPSFDTNAKRSLLSDGSHSEISAGPAPPSYSEFLNEISTNPPQIPDRELKKKLVISDISVAPPHVPAFDRSKKPFFDHHMSLGEFGGTKAGQLRTVIVPSSLMLKFMSAAAGNTLKESETMGILCGKLSQGMFKITNLFIPQQKGGHDSCDMENEEELIVYQDNHNLITLGWIHTHPTQTAFLSSVDLHSHFPWQKMMPEAIAIVCSPKFEQTGIFKLTDHGLDVIGSCREKGFHPHSKEPPLFEDCGHVEISDRDTVVVENKMK